MNEFGGWFEALEERHLRSLSFSEIRRGVQALSSLYVSRRERLDRNSALDGAGKRAAFAMFFGPLHFLLVREIVRALDARVPPETAILDLGCGTGIAGAAWALELNPVPNVVGLDRNSWVLEECKWTYRQLGVRGIVKAANINIMRIQRRCAVVARGKHGGDEVRGVILEVQIGRDERRGPCNQRPHGFLLHRVLGRSQQPMNRGNARCFVLAGEGLAQLPRIGARQVVRVG